MVRSAGILMHISSLPGSFGIGTFGKEAYEFVDFLKKSGITYWQILPLGHTGYGDSPYQCFTAFAGNPYFIDFKFLEEEGLLKTEDYINEYYGNNVERVDYGAIYNAKYKVLRKAYENYKNNEEIKKEFIKFQESNKEWLEDYTLYMALKSEFNYAGWQDWEDDIKFRNNDALNKYKTKLKDEIEYWGFIQYLFDKQWKNLKEYANNAGIKIIGDIPIYVSADSVETWSNPENFKIDKETLEPKVVAGCPPDAFSETGQLWGNIIYDWDYMKSTDYEWWINRISHSLKLYDVIRIDHFRGFESFWEIPYGEETAVNGKWVKGPANDLFDKIKERLGDIEIIAEDLGFLTEDVVKFLNITGYPGMKVIEFAFDGSGQNPYLPHNYIRNCVAYTGTHDNDTCIGWVNDKNKQHEIQNAKKYLGLNEDEGYNFGIIRGVWSSIAEISIAQMQDFLGIGNEGRMNLPSSLGGNWSWRMKSGSTTDELAQKILNMNYMFGRK